MKLGVSLLTMYMTHCNCVCEVVGGKPALAIVDMTSAAFISVHNCYLIYNPSPPPSQDVIHMLLSQGRIALRELKTSIEMAK